jgi:hypothetical protein
MITGQLEVAMNLSKKYRMNVSTVTELQKIVGNELNLTQQDGEKVLTQILQLLEKNKVYLREVK